MERRPFKNFFFVDISPFCESPNAPVFGVLVNFPLGLKA